MSPTPALPATRERILRYLQENPPVTAQFLSRLWGLTRADIRYHLNELLSAGLIEQAPRDLSTPVRAGRPAIHYRLAASSQPNHLPALCGALLDTLFAGRSPQERETVMRELAGRLAPEIDLAGQAGVPGAAARRLNQAVAALSAMGYRARWEASPAGPRVLLYRCPYAVIIADHPELCELDRLLIEHLTKVPVHQSARLNPAARKPPACAFVKAA